MKNKVIYFSGLFCFVLLILMVGVMITATVMEKFYGSGFVHENIYSSYWFVCIWALLAISACMYIFLRRTSISPVVISFHMSFIVILVGALLTYITSVQGRLHLRVGDAPAGVFISDEGRLCKMPFTVSLDSFCVEYYKGTFSPMDYVSRLSIDDGVDKVEGVVSMNNILSYRNYRFYQNGYDADCNGTILSVSYDPWGIAVTYIGYVFLVMTMLSFFFVRRTLFGRLLKKRLLTLAVVMLCMSGTDVTLHAAERNNVPDVLPERVADGFGEMLVYYNGRICPLQTMSDDIARKITGKKSFNGLTSEQFVTGWLFYYDNWKNEPVIKIKGERVKSILGVKGDYASVADFVGSEGYKLESYLQNTVGIKERRELEEANEKFNIISMLSTGSLFRIYPVRNDDDGTCIWYSVSDKLPEYVSSDKWNFIRYSMNYVAENVASGQMDEASRLLGKISDYQKKEASGLMPDEYRIKAERIYNSYADVRIVAMICLTVGICAFVMYIRKQTEHVSVSSVFGKMMCAGMYMLLAYLLFIFILRGVVAGHFPVSNGFETMLFMAMVTPCIALLIDRFVPVMSGNVYSFGYIVSGLSLLVAMIGEANPPVTPLMPVLSSPLLSIHVVTIMLSYSLFAFIMLNGIAAEMIHRSGTDTSNIRRLESISRIMLYPALFLLTSGIFIGAVWANVSWGRYWGWDPKEVWALITMLVYSFAVHSHSIPAFRNAMFFHRYMIAAFLCVVITYFGVNYILGGMHGYA